MIDIEKAKFDPSSFFKSPQHVLDHPTLSREDKIAILQHWSTDERERLVAEEENMLRSIDEGESHLDEIQQALEKLGVNHDTTTSSDTKHG